MALVPNLRVILDGDAARVYRQGEHVKGRVILVLEEEEQIKTLKVNFVGSCATKTTRPFYMSGNDADACQSRREYEERLNLFNVEQVLVLGSTLPSRKYTWDFDFTFPILTKPQCSRWTYGSKYLKDPHPLPPSFHICTTTPHGHAMVSYRVQAKLVRGGSNCAKRVTQMITYHPSPPNASIEPKVTSRVLYAQTWKPIKDTRTAVDRVITKVSRRYSTPTTFPQIVPTLHYVEKIAPGQKIPLLLSLANARDAFGMRKNDQPQCVLDSLVVTITTHTTSMCGQPFTQPEDIVVKQVTCISKQDINQPLSFSIPTKLTTNFRLVDDAECVPSFKTYTITRQYSMSVVVGIKFQDQKFTIRSTTQLEILPRVPREMSMRGRGGEQTEEGDVDPLPLYRERDMDMIMELAPDYETLYSLTPTSSVSPSYDLTLRDEGRDGFVSGTSTPESEIEQPVFRLIRTLDDRDTLEVG
ncbi:hypothetical protein K505DRAFT_380693 [Melanomma pulvis-pyrius CBS 109.77]|uniref:Arrestin-like N-terminal domain-containing protein n=1 Tax=Melanomma pulvis-pyrius CBS 109.77 TaxID=1314802 RepID=A0A6A6WPJ9_9PLEO|nr:hypothetical protein K505DRAFT_380693 [Melanomma pulvis-pyrius CBS 109.77]